jgi:hypothetical protein
VIIEHLRCPLNLAEIDVLDRARLKLQCMPAKGVAATTYWLDIKWAEVITMVVLGRRSPAINAHTRFLLR